MRLDTIQPQRSYLVARDELNPIRITRRARFEGQFLQTVKPCRQFVEPFHEDRQTTKDNCFPYLRLGVKSSLSLQVHSLRLRRERLGQAAGATQLYADFLGAVQCSVSG